VGGLVRDEKGVTWVFFSNWLRQKEKLDQRLASPYVDTEKLERFLTKRFGSGNYTVKVSWRVRDDEKRKEVGEAVTAVECVDASCARGTE
jgi:hypothetical protein